MVAPAIETTIREIMPTETKGGTTLLEIPNKDMSLEPSM
ncbi:uncharacterized protein G2W53_015357 [Senna tora]|uniref:Uncharacterized protein n=1 Tax=Senna tora TaxID=362788 RepID=A0A835C5H6_9FABA|nr:uncharacterized protein G2W53_015357 [Senna tora]